MQRQRSPPFRDCAIQIVPSKQDGAEVVMCVRIIGPERDCLPKMSDRFIEPALATKYITDAVMNQRET